MTPSPRPFGTLADGRAVEAWDFGDPDRVHATVLTYGARLAGFGIGDKQVILRFPDLAGYVADDSYQGAICGRFANRIAHGRLPLDGREMLLAVNDGGHALHGGPVGFDRAVWLAEAYQDGVILRHVSPDGDQGFPGRLAVTVRYSVRGDTLEIAYEAVTDAPTVLNLTNHAYFNLAGAGDILDHTLRLAADHFLPVDAGLIPTGDVRPVVGTAFDLRRPVRLGDALATSDPQLERAGGFDHCFVFQAPDDVPVAVLSADGLVLEVRTSEPAVQLYTGNQLTGRPSRRHGALCLETQHYPDSPNRPVFPSTLLRPEQTWRSRTAFRLQR